jgi:hypothetical protein
MQCNLFSGAGGSREYCTELYPNGLKFTYNTLIINYLFVFRVNLVQL